tara:strand:- start:55 stop:516 length:462 start_codon:yes stop_codon:yes gene_type:complete
MDDIDKKILKLIQKNSSLPLSELSRKVGISSTPCWNRIKRMEEKKIILSKITILNNESINLSVIVFLSINIPNHSENWLKKFTTVINKYDEIVEVHRLTGSNSDYLLKILSSTIKKYDEFQQIFIKEIECTNMSSSISLKTIKKNYHLPLDYI